MTVTTNEDVPTEQDADMPQYSPDVAEQDADTASEEFEPTQADVSVESAVSSEVVPADPATEAPEVQAEVPADGDVSSHTIADDVSSPGATVSDELEGEEDEPDEDGEENYFFAPGDWYVVHTYAGYENKVKANLASRIQSMNMEDKIYEVVVPTEEVMELKSGKMQAVQKKVFPGYILVRMELDDDSWYVVRNTPGVTGFVGSGAKPTPLDSFEVSRILTPKVEDRPKPKLDFEVGEIVNVVGGAFSGYSGPVDTIDVEKQTVRVLLDLFGRETPVELTFQQVTKL
jgi:transcriptional antiterminator NusG